MSTTAQKVAIVLCQRDNHKATAINKSLGLSDCHAASRAAEGREEGTGKECPGACLGLGACARVCPSGAIEITSEGLAVISREKCTGCGKCASTCPRGTIRMVPSDAKVHVLCNSNDRGAVVRMYCQIGCVACQMCVKAAPTAYIVENLLARVVYEHHEQAGPAVGKCPTNCIRDFAEACQGESGTYVPVKTKVA